MAIFAKQNHGRSIGPPGWIRIERGKECEISFNVRDSQSNQPVNWTGHELRFRVYSQFVDHQVVVEVIDQDRCVFEAGGIWNLRLTKEETQSIPIGGMLYKLEHRDPSGEYHLGIFAGISCRLPEHR